MFAARLALFGALAALAAAQEYDYFAHNLVGKTLSSQFTKETDTPVHLDDVQDAVLYSGWPPNQTDLTKFVLGKKSLILTFPGAFVPIKPANALSDYIAKLGELAKLGVTDLIVVCVNDAAVMQAWGDTFSVPKDSKVNVHWMGDYAGSFTYNMDLHNFPVLPYPEQTAETQKAQIESGLVMRTRRAAIYVINDVISAVGESFVPETDPFGNSTPKPTLVDSAIAMITAANLRKTEL